MMNLSSAGAGGVCILCTRTGCSGAGSCGDVHVKFKRSGSPAAAGRGGSGGEDGGEDVGGLSRGDEELVRAAERVGDRLGVGDLRMVTFCLNALGNNNP